MARKKIRLPIVVVHWKDASHSERYLDFGDEYDPRHELIWVGHHIGEKRGHLVLAIGMNPRDKRYREIYSVPNECIMRTKRGIVEL